MAVLITGASFGGYQSSNAQSVEKKVVMVMVDFTDAATNADARGSLGPLGAEAKYRYRDYYNIIFQDNNQPVTHPDAALDPDVYSSYDRGWYQHGSFRRYINDNSFGDCDIVPVEVDAQGGQYGVLNNVNRNGGSLADGAIVWLTIDMDKPSTDDIYMNSTIADKTFEVIGSILPQDWEWSEVDALLIIYAGSTIHGGVTGNTIGGYSSNNTDMGVEWSVYSERNPEGSFNPPAVWFHELVHSAIGSDVDLYTDNAGRYSLMGAGFERYTPPMLDPWLRLTLGWIDYQLYDVAGDWANLELPMVNELDGEDKPWVMVVPITGENPATTNWNYADKAFLIVENRRRVGWDMHLNRDDNTGSQTFGVVDEDFEGGFLVWGAGTLAEGMLRPYEADGDYEISTSLERYGDPKDFFPSGEDGDRFGVWTKPGLVDRDRAQPNLCLTDRTRNVFMSFREYNTTTNKNQIGRLMIDQLVVEAHAYDDTPLLDKSATKYNNQRKVCSSNGDVYMATNSNGIAYVSRSTDNGASWRDVYVMTPITGMGNDRTHGNCDNITLAGADGGVWTLVEEYENQLSKLWRKSLTTENCASFTDPIDHSSGQPLRPSIAGLDDYFVYVAPVRDQTPANRGLYAWISTDAGASWSARYKLPGTDENSRFPSVTVRSWLDEQTQQTYPYYDVVYQQAAAYKGISWYSSRTNQSQSIDFGFFINSQPHHDHHGQVLNAVCSGFLHSKPEYYCINLLSIDAQSGSYLTKAVDVFYPDRTGYLQRDPKIVSYIDGADDLPRNLITWSEGNGARMYYADNCDAPHDWYAAHMSSLMYQSLTSYPLAFMGTDCAEGVCCQPRLATTRVRTSVFGSPTDVWAVTAKSRAQDIADNAVLLGLETGKSVSVEVGGQMQEFRLKGVTHRDGQGQLIGDVRYDYQTPALYWGAPGGTPFDTLTTTEEVTLINDEYVRYDVDVVSGTVSDTTFVEGYLFDVTSMMVLSTSGEFRIPPGVQDTTLTLGLELPSGVPMATVTVHTNAWRGLQQGGSYTRTLSRDHYFLDPASPKASVRQATLLPLDANGLHAYPTETSTGAMVQIVAPYTGPVTLRIHSLLGRELTRLDIPEATAGVGYGLRVPTLRPGMYMLSATGNAGSKTCRILVR